MLKNPSYGTVDREVMTNPDIPTGPKSLYGLLCCYADTAGYCYPGITRLADELNVRERTISNYLKILVDKGIVKRYQKRHNKTSDTYIIDNFKGKIAA
jgi:hypothetical protein